MKQKLLFVDDDIESCLSFNAIFRREYIVRFTTKPLEVIKMLGKSDSEVIFCDFDMPIMNGLELARNLKMFYPEVMRVLITGSIESDEIENALLKNDIQYCIRKPWQRQEIIDILEYIQASN